MAISKVTQIKQKYLKQKKLTRRKQRKPKHNNHKFIRGAKGILQALQGLLHVLQFKTKRGKAKRKWNSCSRSSNFRHVRLHFEGQKFKKHSTTLEEGSSSTSTCLGRGIYNYMSPLVFALLRRSRMQYECPGHCRAAAWFCGHEHGGGREKGCSIQPTMTQRIPGAFP